MKSSELMARAEHALRTGQTEHLFPVIARRALELIAEEKAANRREWVQLDPMKRIDFAFDGVSEVFARMADAMAHVGEVAGNAVEAFLQLTASEQRQSDYVLASGGPR